MYKQRFLKNKLLFSIIIILMILKIFLFFFVNQKWLDIKLGGGNDANFYHAYALGYIDGITSIWNIILRYLNEYGFYSRDGVSYFLFLLNLIFIPILFAKLSNLSFKKTQKLFLYAYLVAIIYPTLYFYTFDIYRDVFMVFAFLVACLFVKMYLESRNFLLKSIFFALSILLGYFLFQLREYLGFAFLSALFLYWMNLTKKQITLMFSSYLILLFIMNYIGFFDALITYRGGFVEEKSGSTLGLDFSNPILFLPNFILSILGQLFGLYITNMWGIILLLVETLPFLLMLKYVFKNINMLNGLGRFLLIFFVLYASIWLIGNDNLGTAVRLRMFNYFAIYICFFLILNKKSCLVNKGSK